ncbi:MAG: hypothetical protein K2X86_10340 [Cytophagaceae bacterium]|nr:hypothetical protein [Cytophagaceae bacterium]
MKKALLLLVFVLSVLSVFSQNVFDRKVNFEYLRLPLQPIKKSIKNYQAVVVMEYEIENKIRREAFAKIVQDYEKKYVDDMAAYDKSIKDNGAKYAQDMIDYNKKITDPKNANIAKPELVLPVKPEKYVPVDNTYYPKTINTESAAVTYIKLDGYEKGRDNAAMVTVLLKGLQYTEPELKLTEKTKTKDGQQIVEREYWFEYTYKYPVGLKVEAPGSGVLCNEYFDDLNKFISAKSDKYKTESELRAAFNRDKVFSSLEDKLLAENLNYVNNVLNSRFGYTRIKAVEEINLVSSKKMSYSDYELAFASAVTGLNQLSADLNKTQAISNLNAGIAIWEKALEESQPQNKKARINGDVTIATLFNIALIAIYANDFAKAELSLNKILALSIASKREQRKVEQVKAFLRDQQMRYEAWKKVN